MNSGRQAPQSGRRRSRASSIARLERYVGSARRRQSVRTCLQAATLILLALAVLTAVGVILGLTVGYTPAEFSAVVGTRCSGCCAACALISCGTAQHDFIAHTCIACYGPRGDLLC